MQRLIRPWKVFALSCALGAVISSVARGGPIEIVSQSATPSFSSRIVDFEVTFNQIPDFALVSPDGTPRHNFAYDIQTNPTPGEFHDFDVVAKRPDAHLELRFFNVDPMTGEFVNPRGPAHFTVEGSSVHFTAGFDTIGDADGKFTYRVFAIDSGEQTNAVIGTTVPLSPALWPGLGIFVLASVSLRRRVLQFCR